VSKNEGGISKNKGEVSKNEGGISKMCVSPREKITPSIEPRNFELFHFR
jgi:hypothetical protein